MVGQLAPDWWKRGVTRPGRRNAPPFETFLEAPRRGVEQRTGRSNGAGPRATKGVDLRRELLFLPSFLILERVLESERGALDPYSERGALDPSSEPWRASAEPLILISGPFVQTMV